MEEKNFDIIILGAGPSGLTAGIYALRAGKKVLIIEKYVLGGQVSSVAKIENYPGVLHANGFELAISMEKQVKEFGGEFVADTITDFDLSGKIKILKSNKCVYKAKAIILASGTSHNTLGVSGEKELIGKGVSYCASCDGGFFRNNIVCVIGGGNASLYDALYLSNICKKVFVIVRKNHFKGEQLNIDKLNELVTQGKVEILYEKSVTEILGNDFVSGVRLNDGSIINVSGVFIAVGTKANSQEFNELDIDENGYIITDENMCTNISGVYACGDIRKGVLKQVVTACADGAIAGTTASKLV